MDYDFAIDVWSIGCTLFELFTGKILFPGSSNNQMIKVMMEVRGRMNPKYYKRGQLWRDYFDDKNNFLSVEYDHVIHRVRRPSCVSPAMKKRLSCPGLPAEWSLGRNLYSAAFAFWQLIGRLCILATGRPPLHFGNWSRGTSSADGTLEPGAELMLARGLAVFRTDHIVPLER